MSRGIASIQSLIEAQNDLDLYFYDNERKSDYFDQAPTIECQSEVSELSLGQIVTACNAAAFFDRLRISPSCLYDVPFGSSVNGPQSQSSSPAPTPQPAILPITTSSSSSTGLSVIMHNSGNLSISGTNPPLRSPALGSNLNCGVGGGCGDLLHELAAGWPPRQMPSRLETTLADIASGVTGWSGSDVVPVAHYHPHPQKQQHQQIPTCQSAQSCPVPGSVTIAASSGALAVATSGSSGPAGGMGVAGGGVYGFPGLPLNATVAPTQVSGTLRSVTLPATGQGQVFNKLATTDPDAYSSATTSPALMWRARILLDLAELYLDLDMVQETYECIGEATTFTKLNHQALYLDLHSIKVM
ncbi:unnamed protein product [Protopolystoma xenopodis]|uniref:Uncharacterized protein n=1 Tax=Protopolystoma xenopodis TaxID=117903 RepID=A0A3S5CDX7_9PLAT|nr:unnamed protein product [Protopolystoma xenopodis]